MSWELQDFSDNAYYAPSQHWFLNRQGLDDGHDLPDSDMYKQHVKALFKNLSRGQNEASRMVVESGPYAFHYIIEGRVCYLQMCDRSYSKKLAFQYLEDFKNEFKRVNGPNIETAARPYAFIKFDTFIQKTKKLYDTRMQRNIAKLNDELHEFHQIMTRNVQEVLGVGEKLDREQESLVVYTAAPCSPPPLTAGAIHHSLCSSYPTLSSTIDFIHV
ncbi:25.3 kDa vesicle transport protein [Eutrema salsugineum]|uniref:25.3 kDa vesicle transport protein n=1 Tax=Eutrema salsugineum TaxID=72664 RepID=UPI000CED6F51|nr:25.3 kDa vesicle transport protein [Eutrema salsugineum]